MKHKHTICAYQLTKCVDILSIKDEYQRCIATLHPEVPYWISFGWVVSLTRYPQYLVPKLSCCLFYHAAMKGWMNLAQIESNCRLVVCNTTLHMHMILNETPQIEVLFRFFSTMPLKNENNNYQLWLYESNYFTDSCTKSNIKNLSAFWKKSFLRTNYIF